MKIIIVLFFALIILSILNIISSQEPDKNVLRAVACISLIKKLNVDQNDQRLISNYLLTCFSVIDDLTLQKLIMTKDSNKLDLDESTIKKLTDFNSLQNKFTQDQLIDFSKDLNKAFTKLKNQGSQRSGGHTSENDFGDSDYDDNNNDKNSGLFGMIIYNLLSLFTSGDSLLPLIGLGILVYLLLRQMRKLCDNNKDKNDSSNNNHKNKKSNNKKKVK